MTGPAGGVGDGVLSLGVLDQSPVPEGSTPSEALANTVELAQRAEQLGYRRYWLAEHHSTSGLAGSAPEVLIAHVAAHTASIVLGSGGVMLPHYSPLKVAEAFRMLHALHPGRIELGVGRAPGSDPLTAFALQRTRTRSVTRGRQDEDDFPQQLAELVAFLHDGFEPDHPFAKVKAGPQAPGVPPLWLLGSSGYSGAYAAHIGAAFSYAHFINPSGGPEVAAFYREHFQPGALLPAPQANVGVGAICADTEAEAERLASSLVLWRLRLERGDPGRVPSVEEALAYPATDAERLRMEAGRRRLIVGDPEQVRQRLDELAVAYGVDELMVVTICHDHKARLRSYELIAEAYDLGAAGHAASARAS